MWLWPAAVLFIFGRLGGGGGGLNNKTWTGASSVPVCLSGFIPHLMGWRKNRHALLIPVNWRLISDRNEWSFLGKATEMAGINIALVRQFVLVLCKRIQNHKLTEGTGINSYNGMKIISERYNTCKQPLMPSSNNSLLSVFEIISSRTFVKMVSYSLARHDFLITQLQRQFLIYGLKFTLEHFINTQV